MDSLVRPDFCNMPKKKTSIEIATGKLISAIQKEWGEELGESNVEASEDVMDRGHNLLQAAKNYEIIDVLGGLSVTQYLGEIWVRRHPSVKEYIAILENELEAIDNV